VLQGEGLLFHKETVAANVAILLKVFGNENLKENTEYALKQISSGSAYQLVLKLSEKNNYAT
ncbi:anthranilate phosphoribosyltransferase, partial [Buchnera aphidicola (Hormaphis cornu)]